MAIRELTLEEIEWVSGAGAIYFGTDLTGLSAAQMAVSINSITVQMLQGNPDLYELFAVNSEMLSTLTPEGQEFFVSQIEQSINDLLYNNQQGSDQNSSYHDYADNAAQYAYLEAWAYYDHLDAVRQAENTLTSVARDIFAANGSNTALSMHQFAEFLIANGYGNLVSGYNPSGIYNGQYVGGSTGSSGVDAGGTIYVTANLPPYMTLAGYQNSAATTYLASNGPASVDYSITYGPRPPAPDSDGDGARDDVDADPSNPAVQNEIVVNGIRQDVATGDELFYERLYYMNNGRFTNYEVLPNGQPVYIPTEHPTEDQLRFKHNYDAAKSALWFLDVDDKPQTSPYNIAKALTDARIDVVSMNLNILSLYSEYRNLVDTGQAGRGASDFTNWIWATKLGGLPASAHPISYSSTDIFGSTNYTVATNNYSNYKYNLYYNGFYNLL